MQSAVVYRLLKFVVVWVEGQISYLEAQETAAVVNFCMRLLQLYSSHNIGKVNFFHGCVLWVYSFGQEETVELIMEGVQINFGWKSCFRSSAFFLIFIVLEGFLFWFPFSELFRVH